MIPNLITLLHRQRWKVVSTYVEYYYTALAKYHVIQTTVYHHNDKEQRLGYHVCVAVES